VVFIDAIAIGLTLFEKSENPVTDATIPKGRRGVDWYDWTTDHDCPSGRLVLRAFSPHFRVDWSESWVESAPGDLVRRLPRIARELEKAVPTLTTLIADAERKAEEEHQRWEAQARQWRREEAARRRTQALKESREELLAIVEQWSLAKRIESFFADLDRSIAAGGGADATVVRARIDRARAMLGGIDALQHFEGWLSPEERLGTEQDVD
jgi:hypothetical protein